MCLHASRSRWTQRRHSCVNCTGYSAPLLISRSALKALQAQINFQDDTLSILGGEPISLRTNSAGQYIVDVIGSPHGCDSLLTEEIMMASTETSPPSDVSRDQSSLAESSDPMHVQSSSPDHVGSDASDASVPAACPEQLSSWFQEDCHVPNPLVV